MLKPEKAYEQLCAQPELNGFDDPTEGAGPPTRWYWQHTGGGFVLARSGWRDASPELYHHLIRPSGTSINSPRPIVTIYAATARKERNSGVVMFALLNHESRWKAVSYVADEELDPVLACIHIITYALDQLKEPCYVNISADEISAFNQYEDESKRANSIRATCIWQALEEGLINHPLLIWECSPQNQLVTACRRAAEMVAAGRSVTTEAMTLSLEQNAPRMAARPKADAVQASLSTKLAESLKTKRVSA